LKLFIAFEAVRDSVLELTIKKATVLNTALKYKIIKCKTGELAIWSGAS